MAELTIKNFHGVHMDNTKWSEGYARQVVGLDIWGLGKNASKLSYPGVLQGIFQVSAGGQAASPSAVTELITGFALYKGQDFAIGGANPGRIYRRDSGNWTFVSGGANGITVSAANAGNLFVYAGNLYYAQNGLLGQYNNTAGNANFQSFTNSSTNPRPMKVFAGNLYVGNDNLIAKYDGTTFTAAALTLPSNYIINSIEIFADKMYITAQDDTSTFLNTTLFIWDGIAPVFQGFFNLQGEAPVTLQVADGKLWVISNKGISTTGTPIYIFDGSNFQKIQVLPIQRNQTDGIIEYGNGLLIASNDGVTAKFEDGVAGAWLINRHDASLNYTTALLFPLRNQLTNKTLGAISSRGYIAAQDITNSTYEVFEIQGSNANSPNIWQSSPIDAGSTDLKMWHAIQLNAEANVTGQTVVVKYRLDYASAFTTLKTFSSTATSNDFATFIPIGRISKTIDIRLELTATNSETTRVHSFTLTYSPASPK